MNFEELLAINDDSRLRSLGWPPGSTPGLRSTWGRWVGTRFGRNPPIRPATPSTGVAGRAPFYRRVCIYVAEGMALAESRRAW